METFFWNIDNYPLKLSTKHHIPFDFIPQNYSHKNSRYRKCYFFLTIFFGLVGAISHITSLKFLLLISLYIISNDGLFCKSSDEIYRVSQEEWRKLRESVPYVKISRYNPKHLCPKLNGYGDKGQRKVWSFCGSTYCTWFA